MIHLKQLLEVHTLEQDLKKFIGNDEDLWYSTQDTNSDMADPSFEKDLRGLTSRIGQGQYLDPTITAERKPPIDSLTNNEKEMRQQFQKDSHRFNPRRAKLIRDMVLGNIADYPKPRKKK